MALKVMGVGKAKAWKTDSQGQRDSKGVSSNKVVGYHCEVV